LEKGLGVGAVVALLKFKSIDTFFQKLFLILLKNAPKSYAEAEAELRPKKIRNNNPIKVNLALPLRKNILVQIRYSLIIW